MSKLVSVGLIAAAMFAIDRKWSDQGQNDAIDPFETYALAGIIY
jgi:hypothetical protein